MFLIKRIFTFFFLRPKLNKSFLCFRFDIYFKVYLVLWLVFKITNVENLHSKNLKRKSNIFQLINFCNCRILLHQIYILSFSFYSPVYLARFSNCMQKFYYGKKIGINHWNLIDERKQPLKKIFFHILQSIKLVVRSKFMKNTAEEVHS